MTRLAFCGFVNLYKLGDYFPSVCVQWYKLRKRMWRPGVSLFVVFGGRALPLPTLLLCRHPIPSHHPSLPITLSFQTPLPTLLLWRQPSPPITPSQRLPSRLHGRMLRAIIPCDERGDQWPTCHHRFVLKDEILFQRPAYL